MSHHFDDWMTSEEFAAQYKPPVPPVASRSELIDLLRTCRDSLECHAPHVAEKIDRVLEREHART